MKSIIISACLFASLVLCNTPIYQKEIQYIPVDIERADSALDITFNNRKDLLNVDQKYVALRRREKDRKDVLRGDLTRAFGPKPIIAWTDLLRAQNFDMIPGYEFKNDLFDMKTTTKQLQTYIIQRSNGIKDKLALLDLKLRERQILEKEITDLEMIKSGKKIETPEAKQRYDDIASNIAAYHTEFDTAIHGMCDTMKKINNFVKKMEGNQPKVVVQNIPKFAPKIPKPVKPRTNLVKYAILPEIMHVIVNHVKENLYTKDGGESVMSKIVKDEAKTNHLNPNKVKGMFQGEVENTVKKTADTIANTAAKQILKAKGDVREISKDIKGSLTQTEGKLDKQIKKIQKNDPPMAAIKATVADALGKLKQPNEVKKMTNEVLKALRRK